MTAAARNTRTIQSCQAPFLIVAIFLSLTHPPPHVIALNSGSHGTNGLSRGDLLKVGFGGIAVGKLVGDVVSRVSRGIAYPDAHEDRVRHIIRRALSEAATVNRPLTVLEVGIGTDCRLIRRGLYDEALNDLAAKGIHQVEITGMDIDIPSYATIQQAEQCLEKATNGRSLNVDLQVVEGDLTSTLPFEPGSFDAIICCLTLCSVSDPDKAVRSIKSLLRPNGGMFGFVEHVAVNPEEPYRFLDWQQQTLDPLQQALAHNCHLHRQTENTIARIFGMEQNEAIRLEHERFLVNDMWPVTCQCSGVIRRMSL